MCELNIMINKKTNEIKNSIIKILENIEKIKLNDQQV